MACPCRLGKRDPPRLPLDLAVLPGSAPALGRSGRSVCRSATSARPRRPRRSNGAPRDAPAPPVRGRTSAGQSPPRTAARWKPGGRRRVATPSESQPGGVPAVSASGSAPVREVPAPATPPAGVQQAAGHVALDQPLLGGAKQAQAKRRDRVSDRTIRKPPPLTAIGDEPADETLQRLVVEFGEAQFGGEVAQGEGDEKATIFTPGRLIDGVVPTAAVGADPGKSVIVQQRASALGALFRLAGDLQRRASATLAADSLRWRPSRR
jgi:hypothetical protein